MNRLLETISKRKTDPIMGHSQQMETALASNLDLLKKSVSQNDVILRRLFGFLKYEDLKSCRLVCTKWENISRQFFIKHSKIIFQFYTSTLLKKWEQDLKMVLEDLTELGITSYGFQNNIPTTLLPILKMKFSVKKTFIKEIYIDRIRLIDNNGSVIKTLDLRCFISPNIRKLYVNSNYCKTNDSLASTRVIVSVDSLRSIKELYLQDCTVIINGKISPEELTLKLITFMKSGVKVEQVTINEFVDFAKIRKLTLWGSFIDSVWEYSDDKNTMSVDLNERVNIETLELYRSKVKEWSTAKWNVNYFSLSKIPLVKHHMMTISKLEIDSAVNLTLLPRTIERLVLRQTLMSQLVNQNEQINPVFLPSLKYLHLHNPSYVPLFSGCEKLTDLELTAISNDKIDLGVIPDSVTKIKLTGVQFFTESVSLLLTLDTLIIQSLEDKWKRIESYLLNVKPKSLIVFDEGIEKFLPNNTMEKFMENQFESFAIGKFFSDSHNLHEKYFQTAEDKKAQYYLFEKSNSGFVLGIDENKFKKLVNVIRF